MADPLNSQADEFRGLCAAIGFIVVNWAVIEQQLDNLVNITFKECGGKSLRKHGDIPRSFNMKAGYLQDCFRSLNSLKPYATEGGNLISRLKNLAQERHDLVHGALTSIESANGVFHFRTIQYEREDHAVRRFGFDGDAFAKLASRLGDTLTELINFSQKLADRFLT